MNQQELEALLAQIAPNGQTARLEFTEETKVRKVKRKVPAASEFGSPTEEEIEVRVPTRTWIDRATGRTVTVEVNEDGSYNKIFDGIEPKNQGAAATKPDDDKPNVTTQQITRNGRTYTVQTTTPKEGGAPTIKVYGPDGKEVPGGLPDESKQPKETKTVVKGADGKQYIRVTVEKPDGTSEVYHTDQNGTRVTLPDDESSGFPGEPAGAPPLNMTPGQVADGLRQYSSYLSQQVKLWKDTGGKQGIAPEQATKLMDQRIKVAEAAGREADNLAARQQGIYGTQITQRGQTLNETASRRGDANTAYNNNLSRFVPQMTMMGAGGGQLVANANAASLAANQAYVDQWGGLRETPPVETPTFLGQIRNASMQGIQTAASGGPVLTGAAGAPPKPPPSAAELEAQRQATMAQNQAAMAAAQAGGAPTAGEPGGPPLAPGPVYGDPPPPPAVNPINAQPVQAPPVPNYRPDATTDPAVTPGPVLLPPPPSDAPVTAAPSAPAVPTPPERMVTITHKATGQRRTIPYSEWVTTYRTTQDQWDAVEDNAPENPMPVNVPYPTNDGAYSQTPSFLPRPQGVQASIDMDSAAMARASQPTPGLDTGAAAFYGHTPENPMIPPGGMRPSFLSQARYGQPYDPRARGLALGIRPDILELALAG